MAARAAVGKELKIGETVALAFGFAPIPKGRPRFGRGFAFTNKRTREYEKRIKVDALRQLGARKPFACQVGVSCLFMLPTKRRVDIDNLIKALLDGLNGVIWRDDSQVVWLKAAKRVEGEGSFTVLVEGVE